MDAAGVMGADDLDAETLKRLKREAGCFTEAWLMMQGCLSQTACIPVFFSLHSRAESTLASIPCLQAAIRSKEQDFERRKKALLYVHMHSSHSHSQSLRVDAATLTHTRS